MNNIDNSAAADFLDKVDAVNKINTIPEAEPTNSLGKLSTFSNNSHIPDASMSPWKIQRLETIPSGGLFYPENAELLLKSAAVKEIRHWSTLDENDPIDIREQIDFILNACTRFSIKGSNVPLSYKDFLEIDRYHILFRIYELTFPNQENKLMANIKCDSRCNNINKVQVTSQNLRGFKYPADVMKYYSPSNRCFVINSSKLGETINLYMPTIGTLSLLRQKRTTEEKNNIKIDEPFYTYGKYLFDDWKKSSSSVDMIKAESLNWNDSKFTVIYKFTDLLEKSKINKVSCVCEKCKKETESHIFLGGSFTIKDIFIISTRLDELIGA
jgi:hypothetical protein